MEGNMESNIKSMQQMLADSGVLREKESLLRQIGHGQSAEVYLMLDENGEIYALKVMKMDDDQTYRKHLRQEAGRMKILEGDPHVVRLYDHWEIGEDGCSYLVLKMEYLKTLSCWIKEELIKRGYVPLAVLWKLAADMGAVLQSMEKVHIVHRDIKPDNIFVSGWRDLEFKLGDFGIAREMVHATVMTQLGSLGTCAPEVAAGEEADFSCDMYSVGAVLYSILNRMRYPYSSLIDLKKKKNPAPPVLGTVQWKDMVVRMTSADRKERFQNAAQYMEALEKVKKTQQKAVHLEGHGLACYEKAKHLFFQEEYQEAEEMALEGYECGSIPCARLIGYICSRESRTEEAYDYLEEAAQKGDPVSACYLSRILFQNAKTTGDIKEAGIYLKQAQDAELYMADYDCGCYYFYGKYGFDQDQNRGLYMIERSAEKNYKEAVEFLIRQFPKDDYWLFCKKERCLLHDML